MKPIILTEYRETLLEYPDSKSTVDTKLSGCIGIHDICRGRVDIRPISTTHNIILCRGCGLRIPIPKQIDTYGKLRGHVGKGSRI